ncbi:tetratricopeptide repeat-containing diguanylate cyclase [Cryobacterium psychrotolerans]|nr:GGDEF domain-containing protein [Cryobacterium psychrotolerans]TFD83032.1 GGDEF domain-containing protein [Cryobacterium psychrotolerans]
MNPEPDMTDAAASVALAPKPSIDELLDACEVSSMDGRHREGAEQAEEVLLRPGVTPTEQAYARHLLSLHRLRLGEHEASVKEGLLALEFLTGSGDLVRQSKLHCILALAFTETHLNETALRHAVSALDAARACDSPTLEFWALSRAGMVHEALGDPQYGLELGRQALALARTLDDPEARFAGLNNLGDACLTVARAQLAQGQSASLALQEALALVEESVQMAHEQAHSFWEMIARTNLVSILIELERYVEAREQAGLVKGLAQAQSSRYMELSNDAQLAEIVRAEGNLDEAVTMMEAQLADPDAEQNPALIIELHKSLFEMHKASGRFEQALAHHEQMDVRMLDMTIQTAGLQSQMLINTIEIEHAHHEAERSRIEAQMERIRAEELDHEAHTDPLTRLPNRRALDRELPPLMGDERAKPLCAAMIDLDHFKRVNDEYGHATGDQVLTAMSNLLRAVTRDTDLAVRVGGEEFLLIFAHTSLEQAELVCERLLASVRTYPWETIAPGLTCTVSAGVSQLKPFEVVSEWLARSDAALYEAKRAGRDRVSLAPA